MHDFLHDSSEHNSPTIEEILDFNYDFISNFFVFINNSQESIQQDFKKFMEIFEFELKNKYFPKLLMLLNSKESQDKTSKDYDIQQKNLNATRLIRPVYWYIKNNNYLKIVHDGKQNYINYCKLTKLPEKQQFKQEILNQKDSLGKKWVIPYLESNLKQLQDYL